MKSVSFLNAYLGLHLGDVSRSVCFWNQWWGKFRNGRHCGNKFFLWRGKINLDSMCLVELLYSTSFLAPHLFYWVSGSELKGYCKNSRSAIALGFLMFAQFVECSIGDGRTPTFGRISG